MASIFLAFQILLLILFSLLLATEPSSFQTRSTQTTHIRINITRVSSGKPWLKSRYTPKDVYAMNLVIGTPPVQISAIMDTGSDLIWTKCKTERDFASPFFDPSMSSSFFKPDESCDSLGLYDCQQQYVNGLTVNLSLGTETLTIGNKRIPNVIFACGIPSKDFGYDGIVGMGRGKLSIFSQLNKRVFSYCLPGPKAIDVIQDINIQTMPLLEKEGKPYYYISLLGISVGETRLPVTKDDFAINNANGDGGMIIDSGTTFTYLERRIVDMINNEFMNQTELKKYDGDAPYEELKNCFNSSYNMEIIPKLVFHFEGANWELPRENYIYEKDGVACLAIVANPDDETVSIFGNMQQQNTVVIYNLVSNSIIFVPQNCNGFVNDLG